MGHIPVAVTLNVRDSSRLSQILNEALETPEGIESETIHASGRDKSISHEKNEDGMNTNQETLSVEVGKATDVKKSNPNHHMSSLPSINPSNGKSALYKFKHKTACMSTWTISNQCWTKQGKRPSCYSTTEPCKHFKDNHRSRSLARKMEQRKAQDTRRFRNNKNSKTQPESQHHTHSWLRPKPWQ